MNSPVSQLQTKPSAQRVAEYSLLAVLVVGVIQSIQHVATAYRDGAYLDHVAGAWTTLAFDLAHGIFYRPILGPIGYGGTRFMPLYFSAHALLISLGLSPVAAGYVLSALSALLLLAAVFFVVRALGGTARNAVVTGAIIAVIPEFQRALVTVRGDILAGALSVCGLFLASSRPTKGPRFWAMIVLFALAFACKLTSGFALVAVVAWYLISGERKHGLQLLGMGLLSFAAVVGIAEAASDGRMLSIFAACAGANMTVSRFAGGPIELLRTASLYDFGTLALVTAAFAISCALPRRLTSVYFLTALLATMVIFASPGTDYNHLLDLEVAAVLAIVSALHEFSPEAQRAAGWFFAAVVLMMSATLYSLQRQTLNVDREFAARVISETKGIAVAENSLWPVSAGVAPVVADPFMLRVVSERDPRISAPLAALLRARQVPVVLLMFNLEEYRWWYERTHFGPAVYNALHENYALTESRPGVFVYRPKTQ
jgi:hypothetical protein